MREAAAGLSTRVFSLQQGFSTLARFIHYNKIGFVKLVTIRLARKQGTQNTKPQPCPAHGHAAYSASAIYAPHSTHLPCYPPCIFFNGCVPAFANDITKKFNALQMLTTYAPPCPTHRSNHCVLA